ncbi:MAG: hypothetical protein EXR58_03370 [Chloroflexi bacterium]|nr:hypothetical protein [Chloroflexota bacterium]
MTHDMTHLADPVLEPYVRGAIERIGTSRFSIKRLIEALQATPEGRAAYDEALRICGGEDQSQMAHLIVHGQTIPELLRHSGLVRFAGFIHGEPDEDDGFAVPSWWRKLS